MYVEYETPSLQGRKSILGDFNCRLTFGREAMHKNFDSEAENVPSLTSQEAHATISPLKKSGFVVQQVSYSQNGSPYTFFPSDYERNREEGFSLDFHATNDISILASYNVGNMAPKIKLFPVDYSAYQQVEPEKSLQNVTLDDSVLTLIGKRRDHQMMIATKPFQARVKIQQNLSDRSPAFNRSVHYEPGRSKRQKPTPEANVPSLMIYE